MMLTGKAAYFAPAVDRYWVYAIAVTAVGVAVSLLAGIGFSILRKQHGLLLSRRLA
jgi:hypothetical protein